MAIGAYFSQNMPIALGVMAFVWIGHVIALAFIVKTKIINEFSLIILNIAL